MRPRGAATRRAGARRCARPRSPSPAPGALTPRIRPPRPQAYDLWSAVHTRAAAASSPAEWHGHKPAAKILGSDIVASPKRGAWRQPRTWSKTDKVYIVYMAVVHALCLLAPMTFSWSALACFGVCYFLTGCIGITFSFHRNLSHKAFAMPKWLEYAAAYCGVLAAQGEPIEWVSSHRYHHAHCDTPSDPHTPYEGFWWSHMGWLLDGDATQARVADRSNASDMASQPFYRWIADTYGWHVVGSAALLFALGGLPWLVWGFAVRVVWVYHITWFVNSLAHVYGSQSYATGDLSRNNALVALLAFGEGCVFCLFWAPVKRIGSDDVALPTQQVAQQPPRVRVLRPPRAGVVPV